MMEDRGWMMEDGGERIVSRDSWIVNGGTALIHAPCSLINSFLASQAPKASKRPQPPSVHSLQASTASKPPSLQSPQASPYSSTRPRALVGSQPRRPSGRRT